MSKQVLSIEQMDHLRGFGLDTSQASMALIYENKYGDIVDWEIVDDDTHESHIGEYSPYLRKMYGVFTLQDILDLLPKEILVYPASYELKMWYDNGLGKWCISYVEYGLYEMRRMTFFKSDNIIDAAYEMLCWCIENGHIKTK